MPRVDALLIDLVERRARDAELRAGQNQHGYRHERRAIDDFVHVLGPIAAVEGLRIRQEAVLGHEHVVATIVLLPVPFMPAMYQVSSIVSSRIGISDRPRFAISPVLVPHVDAAGRPLRVQDPDAHGHRPFTRQPPSTGVASPCGASEPATHASGSAPQTSRCARSGNSAASHAQTLIRLATHAVDPQPRPISAITSM